MRSIGNENLECTLVDNFDLRWEYFNRPGEIYAASVFHKNFRNPIERALLTINGQVQFQNVAAAKCFRPGAGDAQVAARFDRGADACSRWH